MDGHVRRSVCLWTRHINLSPGRWHKMRRLSGVHENRQKTEQDTRVLILANHLEMETSRVRASCVGCLVNSPGCLCVRQASTEERTAHLGSSRIRIFPVLNDHTKVTGTLHDRGLVKIFSSCVQIKEYRWGARMVIIQSSTTRCQSDIE